MVNGIVKQILDSGKITKEDLDSKISDKMKALSGLISEEGAAHIIAGELGINVGPENTSQNILKIKDILGGMKNVFILGKVVSKYDMRSFGEDGSGKVGSLLLGDETGFSRLTFWNDKCEFFKEINEGDVLEIQNAYTRENNNRVEIHMGSASNCVVNPEGKSVEVKERQEIKENLKKINQITEDDVYVDILATIVQVYDPRFFEVCPECNKRLQIIDGGKFQCATHGEKEPSFNYVMNLFLDDGSSNIRATLWKEQIQSLLNLKDEEVVALKDNPQKLEEIKNELLGKIIKAHGKIKRNEVFNQNELVIYRMEMDPTPVEEKKIPKTQETPKKEEIKEDETKFTEELIGSDDEEVFNIEDLDDED